MRRRDLIKAIGVSAAAWPLAARAQQGERTRRIGVLMNLAADDVEGQARLEAFLKGLQEAGWEVGRNVRVEIRWTGGVGDGKLYTNHLKELLAFAPDVILTTGGVLRLREATQTVPIVFASATDPVGAGLCGKLGAAGRQRNGLYLIYIQHSWQVAGISQGDRTERHASGHIRDPGAPSRYRPIGGDQAVAPSMGIALRPIVSRDPAEIEHAMAHTPANRAAD